MFRVVRTLSHVVQTAGLSSDHKVWIVLTKSYSMSSSAAEMMVTLWVIEIKLLFSFEQSLILQHSRGSLGHSRSKGAFTHIFLIHSKIHFLPQSSSFSSSELWCSRTNIWIMVHLKLFWVRKENKKIQAKAWSHYSKNTGNVCF